MNVTRRSLLAALALLPASSALAAPLGSGRETAALAEIIRAVGGVSGIPELLVEACAKDFRDRFGDQAVATLLRSLSGQTVDAPGDAALEDQLRWIAAYLYTGEVEGSDGERKAAFYPWALAWSVLGYANAPGLCGLPFGEWQQKPQQGEPA